MAKNINFDVRFVNWTFFFRTNQPCGKVTLTVEVGVTLHALRYIKVSVHSARMS
jgi:hypothetical protein